jgi:hypothetical protein
MERMMARLLSFTERPWTAAEAILYGTLAVGVLDVVGPPRAAHAQAFTPHHRLALSPVNV